jgi:hypothetical protein
MTGIFEEMPTPEEILEAFGPTWEGIADSFKEVIGGVNDALKNGKASHEQIIEFLTFLVTGSNKIVYDLIQEGSRMKPRQNFTPALIVAQEKALFEMNHLNWRK